MIPGRLSASLVALVVTLFVSPAWGQEQEEARARARTLSEMGQAAYDSGLFKDAAEAFLKANAHFAHPNNLFNAAKAYEMAAAYDEAVATYRAYLELYEEKNGTPAPDLANLERTIEVLREKAFLALPEVTVDSDPPGADIYIDDPTKVLGQTPFTTHLPHGAHKVFLKKAGYQGYEKEFEIRSREPLRLTFAMEKIRNEGGLRFHVNIRKARIYVDGKVQAVTPYDDVLSVEAGQHQVVVEKDRYTEVSQLVMVETGQVHDVHATLHLKNPPFSWRGGLGITSMILGAGALGVSVGYLRTLPKSQRSFSGDTYFNTVKTWTYVGYGVGGALLAAGIGLTVWEFYREEVDSEDAISSGSSLPPIMVGTDGDGFYLGASARF